MSTNWRTDYQKVTHCIFDFDGTLINSESFLTESIGDVLQKYDKSFDWDLKSKTVGLHLGLSGPLIIEELDLPTTVAEFTEDVLKTYTHKMNTGSVQFMPGAQQIVQHFAAKGIPQAVCSACTTYTFSLKVKHFGDFFDTGKHFEHILIAGDHPEVKRNKPHADPYLHCISLFDPPPDPQQVLVFEDSPTGLKSALSAGCRVVMIPDPKYDKSQFVNVATTVIDSLHDFDPQPFGLPKL